MLCQADVTEKKEGYLTQNSIANYYLTHVFMGYKTGIILQSLAENSFFVSNHLF